MIGYLRGRVSFLGNDSCFLDVGGVGYRVYVSTATRSKLVLDEERQLFTYLSVREDAMQLYGFLSQEEYDLFELLLSVSGIGPKMALGILSAITASELAAAIQRENTAALTKLPGIGKKTAARMILELKDKLSAIAAMSDTELAAELLPAGEPGDETAEAAEALLAFGYTQAEIQPVLKKAKAKCKTVEEMIKFSLREFGGGK